MDKAKHAFGLDFGTNSVRALIVDVNSLFSPNFIPRSRPRAARRRRRNTMVLRKPTETAGERCPETHRHPDNRKASRERPLSLFRPGQDEREGQRLDFREISRSAAAEKVAPE